MEARAGQTPDDSLEPLEIDLFVQGIYRRYGYDFQEYTYASLRRRLLRRMEEERVSSISELLARVLHEPVCMDRVLLGLTVHTTAMFRDPSFYVALREKVVPVLRTYPFVRIWLAGCSTGEEVYSLAILLAEEGLSHKSRIYATDVSEAVLRRARSGIYPLAALKAYTQNYIKAGGKQSFSEYYTTDDECAVFRPALRDQIAFAVHNLATDASFNEFNLILCRNVMIYFKKPLQERVHKLTYDSLPRLGVLALGRSESLKFTSFANAYEEIEGSERIYRKVR